MLEEGRVREFSLEGGIFCKVVLRPRVISDVCHQAVRPEGKSAGAEESAHNVGAQGIEPVCIPCCGGVVETVACGSEWGNAGSHDGDLCNRHCDLKLAHGAVTLTVCGCDQALHDARTKVQAPETQALERAP